MSLPPKVNGHQPGDYHRSLECIYCGCHCTGWEHNPCPGPKQYGLGAAEREQVLRCIEHYVACTSCKGRMLATGPAHWEVLGGGEHLGFLSRYERTVSVRCSGCGEIRLFDLAKVLSR